MLPCVSLMHMSWPQQKIAFIYISILHPTQSNVPKVFGYALQWKWHTYNCRVTSCRLDSSSHHIWEIFTLFLIYQPALLDHIVLNWKWTRKNGDGSNSTKAVQQGNWKGAQKMDWCINYATMCFTYAHELAATKDCLHLYFYPSSNPV